MRIISWNVNGLKRLIKNQEIYNFIEKYDADIYCIQEVKLKNTEQNVQFLKDSFQRYNGTYNLFWNLCQKSSFHGTLVLTKINPIKIYYDIKDHQDEGRVITLEFEDSYLVNVYVPNAGVGQRPLYRLKYRTQEWDPEFKKFLINLSKNKNVIVCGDLNIAHNEIDLANPEKNRRHAGFTDEERQNFSSLLENGFVDVFRHLHPKKIQYTYWSYFGKAKEHNRGWRLDYFIVNDSFIKKIKDFKTYDDVTNSDHCPIELILKK